MVMKRLVPLGGYVSSVPQWTTRPCRALRGGGSSVVLAAETRGGRKTTTAAARTVPVEIHSQR